MKASGRCGLLEISSGLHDVHNLFALSVSTGANLVLTPIRLGRLLEGSAEGRFAVVCLLLFALTLVLILKFV